MNNLQTHVGQTKKVVTVTLNPALDLTGSLDTLKLGSVNLVEQSSFHAAGKGVNVAKVLSELGAEVTVTGFLGQDNPELFQQLFQQIGVSDKFIQVEGATRINVKLVEEDGRVSDINFPGVQVSNDDIAKFENTLFELTEDHDYFVIAGSLPGGITPELCASWIKRLHKLGKRVFFDSSKAALKVGMCAQPWLVKPNEEELSDFVGHPLTSKQACRNAAMSLYDHGVHNIVVSMGADGVMWLQQDECLQAKPPKMDVVSTVGAGDTLVAGLCWGHMQQWNKYELLRFATALSALAVSQVGVGITSQQELDSIKLRTEVSELHPNTQLDNN